MRRRKIFAKWALSGKAFSAYLRRIAEKVLFSSEWANEERILHRPENMWDGAGNGGAAAMLSEWPRPWSVAAAALSLRCVKNFAIHQFAIVRGCAAPHRLEPKTKFLGSELRQYPKQLKTRPDIYNMGTEFPIPSCREVFRKNFREFPRLVGRYCS